MGMIELPVLKCKHCGQQIIIDDMNEPAHCENCDTWYAMHINMTAMEEPAKLTDYAPEIQTLVRRTKAYTITGRGYVISDRNYCGFELKKNIPDFMRADGV